MKRSVLMILILGVFVVSLMGFGSAADGFVNYFTSSSDVSAWSVNQITSGFWPPSLGGYDAFIGSITSVSDPYIYKNLTNYSQVFDESFNRIEINYTGYASGPTRLKLYYIDGRDCFSYSEACSQYWPNILLTNGIKQTINVEINSVNWTDNDGNISGIRFDFEGATALGNFFIESIKFYENSCNFNEECPSGKVCSNGCSSASGASCLSVMGECIDPVIGACGGDSSQLIMRLSSPTNAHGSTWSGSSYSTEICYNSIFGTNFTGANPQSCTGNNKVLDLSSTTNAHAEIPYNTCPLGMSCTTAVPNNYNTNPICYGNLTCRSRGTACNASEKLVVSLSDMSNAHLSNISSASYSINICCQPWVAGAPPNNLYWSDTTGLNTISNAQVGDTVKLVATGVSSGVFTILDKDLFSNTVIKENLVGVVENGRLVYNWQITEQDKNMANGLSENFDEFYFTLSSVSGETSGYLSISGAEDDDELDVTILSPACGSYYNISQNFTIKVEATDFDDIIVGNLTIGNGVVGYSVVPFTNGIKEFNHSFASDGNYQIKAEGWNSRGDKARHISNIMILNKDKLGSYVAACISSPKDYENLPSGPITFDASATKGVNVKTGGVYEVVNSNSPNPTERMRFKWYWTFIAQGPAERYSHSISFLSGEEVAYQPTMDFPISGGNKVDLRVSFS